MTDKEIVGAITSIIALYKLGRYTMAEAFQMIDDLIEEGYR